MVFSYSSIHSSFTDCIGSCNIDLEFGDEVDICHTCRDRDCLFDGAFEKEGCEEVEEVDVADYVDGEGVEEVFLEGDGVVGSVCAVCMIAGGDGLVGLDLQCANWIVR
jgi:hypothetical protein